MTNELLGPYWKEQVMMVPSSARPPDWSGAAWDAWMRSAIASGAITPPIGERERVRVWPWVLVGIVCIAGAFAYGAMTR